MGFGVARREYVKWQAERSDMSKICVLEGILELVRDHRPQVQELRQWRLRLKSLVAVARPARLGNSTRSSTSNHHYDGRSKSRNLQIFYIPLCSYSCTSSLW